MRISGASVKDFKRFTDLQIVNIPLTARLIMLAGPNGSGKSSFFDALTRWHNRLIHGQVWNDDYHLKTYADSAPQSQQYEITATFHHPDPLPTDQQEKLKLIYARSAYRNDPEFQSSNLKRMPGLLEEARSSTRMIDNEAMIGRNYQRLASQVFDIFDMPPLMTDEFIESIIKPIREPLEHLFPDLVLDGLANPLEDGTFRFTKGLSEGFHFKNLSGGEKAVFDLVLDLAIATRAYDNTLFCIDEPEAHMNARLQSELLSVLYGLVPENCQLILATHSIGMMRRAKDIAAQNPGSVVFLDFGGRDFDQTQIINPAKVDIGFWTRAYDVALDDLTSLVAPERVVICEGEPQTPRSTPNYSHDARSYNTIFGSDFPETRFVPGGNALDIEEDRRGLAYALGVLIQGTEIVRLIDRDARSDNEIAELKHRGIRVLTRRNLESYLFDDEVLRALAISVGKEDRADELLAEKERIRAARSQDGPDDLKPPSGEIYVACKTVLGLSNPGNTVKSFMRDTLAPLITPDMPTYEELKRDIFE